MFNNLIASVSRGFGRFGLQVRKHSPEILLVTGIASGVAAAVVACNATLKVNDILDEQQGTLEKIERVKETMPEKYSEEDAKNDIHTTHIQTGLKVLKTYAPAIGLGVLSITSLLGSHGIMRKRHAALAATYAISEKAFREYRERVTTRYGADADKELLYDISTKKIDSEVTDPETGETKKTKEIVKVAGIGGNEYSRYFDETCLSWEKDNSFNLTFLNLQQNYFNTILNTRGHVFLNDVYDQLGIPRTKMGQCVGWVKKNPKEEVSDGYVDFGITEVSRETEDGHFEPAILLNFNVDGSILDLI